jgi:hypothetical protein
LSNIIRFPDAYKLPVQPKDKPAEVIHFRYAASLHEAALMRGEDPKQWRGMFD